MKNRTESSWGDNFDNGDDEHVDGTVMEAYDGATFARTQIYWHDEEQPAKSYRMLGTALARAGAIFRSSERDTGLIMVLDGGDYKQISKGADLAPVIADCIDLYRFHNGKQKAGRLGPGILNEMLRTETFLSCFAVLERVTVVPEYLPGFNPTIPGYNNGGEQHRCFYLGERVKPASSCLHINEFLDVMDFESQADRANAVAGLLTVVLRQFWPGAKPVIVATASKSHSGKDTVLDFIAGQTATTSVSWEAADWATQKAITACLSVGASPGMIRLENARVTGNGPIASAFVERFVTDPAPTLYSPGVKGDPRRIHNNIVMAISTNFGMLSEDLLNRSLPIHLEPKGSITDRKCTIGNPRHQYLPLHRDDIAAEAHGMIARWREAGKPLVCEHYHPCTEWSQTIGGILKVNGIKGFLGNYAQRRIVDDPIRNGIALLGSKLHGNWMPLERLVQEVIRLGLLDALVPKAERSGVAAQMRGLGKTLSRYVGEEFVSDTDEERVVCRLEKARRRFEGGKIEVRYRFLASEHSYPEIDEDDGHSTSQTGS